LANSITNGSPFTRNNLWKNLLVEFLLHQNCPDQFEKLSELLPQGARPGEFDKQKDVKYVAKKKKEKVKEDS
jgi:hypothetical protein